MMTHDDRAAYIRAIIRHRAPEVSDADLALITSMEPSAESCRSRSASKSWTCSKRWKPSWTSWSRPAWSAKQSGMTMPTSDDPLYRRAQAILDAVRRLLSDLDLDDRMNRVEY